MSELFELSAVNIFELIRNKEITVLDYAKALAERVELKEPSVHAWKYFDENYLFNKATELDNMLHNGENTGEIFGIPVGIKDIFNTADMPTCMGSPIWEGFTPGNNARVVADILYENGLVMGKTVTAEFAVHHPGATLNPHNKKYIPGTSSSGSAAAVATGMVPLALGTQTAGSTTRPASYCGVYGFKPSFGIVPRTAILKTLDTLDHVTIFSRCAADARKLLDVIRVKGKNHPYVHQYMDNNPIDIKKSDKIRIAFVKTHVWENAKDYMKNRIIQFTKELEGLGNVEINEVTLPDPIKETHRYHNIIYTKALSYYFSDEYKNHYDQLSDSFKAMVESGQAIPKEEYHAGLRHQVEAQEIMDTFFEEYDFILSMSTVGEAPSLENSEELPDAALIWTYLHLPSITVPVGKGPNDMPLGLQLVSSRYGDRILLDFVEMLEERKKIKQVSVV